MLPQLPQNAGKVGLCHIFGGSAIYIWGGMNRILPIETELRKRWKGLKSISIHSHFFLEYRLVKKAEENFQLWEYHSHSS
jgi:hypothetical protein